MNAIDSRVAWLAPFCLPADFQYSQVAIAEPWSQDGYVYATDGRIAVRVKSGIELASEGKKPDCPALFLDFAIDGLEWIKTPEVYGPPFTGLDLWWRQPERCECCGGKTEELETVSAAFEPHWIGGHWFARRYLWLIHRIPNAEIAIVERSRAEFQGVKTWCLLFRGDTDVQGVLMGQATPSEAAQQEAAAREKQKRQAAADAAAKTE